MMKSIEDKINKLKEKLDALVIANAPYEEIYKVSRELDTYISEYYREKVFWWFFKTFDN